MLSLRNTLFSLFLLSIFPIHNANGQDNQLTPANTTAPFSGKGFSIKDFVHDTFNRPTYASEILPAHLRDLSALLHQGSVVPRPVIYTNALLKLFGNSIKGAPYVGAYGFLEFTEQLSANLEHLVSLKALAVSPASYYQELHNLLYDAFLTKFDELKNNPDAFFASLTNNAVLLISQHLNKSSLDVSRHETLHDIQPMLMRFLELSLNKLMWNSQEPANIWPSVKGIATELEALYDKEFIGDQSDLDDLYWSLVHRFALFLDLSATTLPLEFFQKIQAEVATGNLLLVTLPEQETYLMTKKEVLDHALKSCIAKRVAFDRGIIPA